MELAVVILGSVVGQLAWWLTVTLCEREEGARLAAIWREVAYVNGRRVRVLEDARRGGLRHASRMVRALSDLLAER